MAKLRSPNCPQITFEDAANKARKVYEVEHTHPADKRVIAEDLGYTSISGASLSAIGALRQYGLIEPAGDGLRISDDAVAYFELPVSKERTEVARRMMLKPSLFEELHAQFGDTLPSEGNLRHTLIKKGFLPKTAEEVLGVYRENLELVGVDGSEYTREVPTTTPELKALGGVGAVDAPPPAKTITRRAEEISLPVGIGSDGEVVFAHVRFDSGIKRNLVASLRALLEAMEKTLP